MSGAYASVYPPGALLLFSPLAALPYNVAFAVWNAALFLALLAIWGALTEIGRVERGSLEGVLVAGALVTFPGVHHSVAYHRIPLVALAVFFTGIILWKRERTLAGAAVWGLLVPVPSVLAFIVGTLLVCRQWKEAWTVLWLAMFQFLPALAGIRPMADITGFAASLAEHAGKTVFFDSQSLAVAIFKTGLLAFPVQPIFRTPVFQSTALFEALRWAGLAASLWVLFRVARGRRPVWEKVSVAAALALLGSVYSHAGDQLWLIPLLAMAWPKFRERLGVNGEILLGILVGVNCVILILSGPFRLSWFSAGFWTPLYLLLAGGLYLRFVRSAKTGSQY